MPPLQVPDEHGHFIRAYAISRGEIVAQGIPELPAPIISFVMRYPESANVFHKFTSQEMVHDLSERPNDPSASTALTTANHHTYIFWGIIGSATYCPIVYVPASLGIWMARTVHASPLLMMYAARMFNILAFVAALAVSFRLAPGYRALMTAVALLPMSLQQAGGISGDPVTIALSFVALSLVLHARERLVGRRYLIVVAVIFTMLGLCKFSIWALPLLLLIPVSAFKNRRAWLAYISAISVGVIAALLIWNWIDSDNMVALRALRLTAGIDVTANSRLITGNPMDFARQLLSLAHYSYKSEISQFLGAFGWTQFSLPFWARLMYLLLLLFVGTSEFSTKPLLAWERGVLLLVFLGGAVFVHAVIFLSDGKLCGSNLDRLCFEASAGVQGRYFLPFCLCGLLTLRQNRANLSQTTLLKLITLLGTIHAVAALALIQSRFYL
jgi:uncharacterized membrane protein